MNINEITFNGKESLSCALHDYSLRELQFGSKSVLDAFIY